MDSISAITTLVSTVIYGFQCIQISRAFDGEFKLYQAQQAILQLRLLRWAQAVGLNNNKEEYLRTPLRGDEKKREMPTLALKGGPSQINYVEDLLHSLKLVLERAQRDSLKWKPEDTDEKPGSFEDDEDDLCPPRFRRLNLKLRELIDKRSRNIATRVGDIKWMLYQREQCESFTAQVIGLLDQLERFVEPESKLKELIQDDSKALGDSLNTLLEVIGKCDPRLQEAAKKYLQEQEDSTKVTFSATNNYGQQIGVFRAEMRGISFGTNNTINNQW